MSLNCEMTMDLIALYHDGLASASTKKAVAEHLKHCPQCRESYAQYRRIYRMPKSGSMHRPIQEGATEQEYRRLAARMRQKRLLAAAGFFAYVCGSLCLTAIMLLKSRRETETSFFDFQKNKFYL
ncbi:zf-HC2 domain-containing protein [Anaerotignum lactatifermentans]|uniref:Anti-sigma-W factor RsiW n=1 Tax=Anaerotignum lactatifermentans TaxID=160404 RepID=A0ABS2G5Q9_9FIRM|nr:zf-HC2 domain-containing protein [Anaerotignum lactatifermentans]MBM6828056.1 zf-HC2 domain-containing protein [Anaerotignum lactatifermentans]MBM6876781.1 zf-HC2 domain-containing protein [Anaerotignum lactatifermentans]MBM6949639.1 zf-HC2 domain-containing protein [Anaerotignum lactatifermentans]